MWNQLISVHVDDILVISTQWTRQRGLLENAIASLTEYNLSKYKYVTSLWGAETEVICGVIIDRVWCMCVLGFSLS